MGDNRFIAEKCHNATMQRGDTFSALQFTLGRELTMANFCRNNEGDNGGRSYVVGTKNGITTLQLLDD